MPGPRRRPWQPGDRIGALRDADDKVVNFFGYGVYEGEEVPPWGLAKDAGITNPKLRLDNGKVVWGQECWWGPEEKIKELIGGREIIEVEPYDPEKATTDPSEGL